MRADVVLMMLLSGLGLAALPALAWWRAQRRIRHLEMSLLAQASDADRYDDLRALVQQIADQTEQLADTQGELARRLSEREALPAPRVDPARSITPH